MQRLLILIVIILAVVQTGKAQDFKKIRVGAGIGYASASGKNGSGGLLLYMEPGYRYKDEILLGLRIEHCTTTRGSNETLGVKIDEAGITSLALFGQYFYGDEAFRPYAGLGLGVFFLDEVIADGELATIAESKVGLFPRVGFELVHFNFSIDYNIIPKSNFIDRTSSTFSNSYFGFRIGATFGGGDTGRKRYNPRTHKRIRSK